MASNAACSYKTSPIRSTACSHLRIFLLFLHQSALHASQITPSLSNQVTRFGALLQRGQHFPDLGFARDVWAHTGVAIMGQSAEVAMFHARKLERAASEGMNGLACDAADDLNRWVLWCTRGVWWVCWPIQPHECSIRIVLVRRLVTHAWVVVGVTVGSIQLRRTTRRFDSHTAESPRLFYLNGGQLLQYALGRIPAPLACIAMDALHMSIASGLQRRRMLPHLRSRSI